MRVTEILRRVGLSSPYSGIDPGRLQFLRHRGTALHAAIALHETGRLDLSSVHEEILPGLEAYRAWAKDVQHEAWASEIELTHSTWGFTGHPDRIGLVNGEPAVIDWKYSEAPDLRGGKFQLAAYRMLINDVDWFKKVHECYLVALSPSGKGYRMHRLTDANAEQVFQAAVILYNALQERGDDDGDSESR